LRAKEKGDSHEKIDLTDSFIKLKVKDFSTRAEVQMPSFIQSTAKRSKKSMTLSEYKNQTI
jgi:hypothetical protein